MKKNEKYYWRVEIVGFGKKPTRAAMLKIGRAVAFVSPNRIYAVELIDEMVVYTPVEAGKKKGKVTR